MSIWEKYQTKLEFPTLKKDKEVDILIIGGGIAGLTTMYYLKDFSSICLVDAGNIGKGVTQNTTGKLTFLQETIYTDLEKNIGKDTAISYLNAQKEAIQIAKEIIEKEKIECDLEKVDSYIFTLNEKEIKKIKEEKTFLEEQKIEVYEDKLSLKLPIKYHINVKDTYVFNPIKYLNHLKEILASKPIYENTKVIKITLKKKKYICFTECGKITAKKVIVACHYPFFTIPFLLPLKSHIEKSYLIACKCEKNEKYSCINIEHPSLSVRFYSDLKNNYKIHLASSHNTCTKQNDKKDFLHVQRVFQIKEEDIVSSWSNMDIITDDKLPYIGKIKKGLYLATGFNTWGMTNGILAGKILSDAMKGNKNKYEKLFSPHRCNFYKIKRSFMNIGSNLISFIGSKWQKKKWYPNALQFTKINGKKVAIYIDEQKKEHIVYTTCPHLGCSLIFNETEKTWDCPCHSSRFDIDGKCIKGPSLYDISYKK